MYEDSNGYFKINFTIGESADMQFIYQESYENTIGHYSRTKQFFITYLFIGNGFTTLQYTQAHKKINKSRRHRICGRFDPITSGVLNLKKL